MKFITLDFETFFSPQCNIKKLGTSQYVQHSDFHCLTMAWKTPKMKHAQVLVGDEINDFFDRLRPHAKRVVLCGHHLHFDGYIASYHYGFIPSRYVCTLAMAQPHHSQYRPTSLESLAQHYKLGDGEGKIKGVLDEWKGLRWEDADEAQREELCYYNRIDTELTEQLAGKLLPLMPRFELDIIDMTIRMFTDPSIEIDAAKARQIINEEVEAKDSALISVFGDKIPLDVLRTKVRSNPGFAELLHLLGVEPPMKISPTTGQWTHAFAKADLPFQALEHHEDERVRKLYHARVTNKTSINQTRAQAMLDRSNAPVPLYLKYCSAHTFRFGGGDGFNPQNLPRDGRLRSCLRAPEGYLLVAADASQIEARDTAVFSEQWDLVDEFAAGVDVYSSFASDIYGFPVNKDDNPFERFIGKTCVAGNTLVLTKRGWIPIVNVKQSDQLWDGVEWVNHQGVSYMGQKQTILLSGVELTPDHGILVGSSDQWMNAQDVLENPAAFQSALSLATLPSSGTKSTSPVPGSTGAGDQFAAAVCVGLNTATLRAASVLNGLQRAMLVPSESPATSVGGSTKTLCPTTSTGLDSSTDSRRPSDDAILRVTPHISTMGNVVSKSMQRGSKIVQSFFGMFKHWTVGIIRNSTWTGSTSTGTTNRETSGFAPALTTCPTNEKLKSSKPVYDILNAGKRSRFTILSSSGPLIVHNCILGLGFQCGANKFHTMLESGTMGPPVDISFAEAEKIVQTYRKKYYCIKETWRELQDMIPFMMHDSRNGPKEFRGLVFEPGGTLLMPNGLRMHYPDLGYEVGDYGTAEFSYRPYDGRYKKQIHKKLYGGSLLENCIAEDTEVLTPRGWVPIQEVRLYDKVHDGVEWVSHDGVISKGLQGCVTIDGVQMTPDHEVLTDEGWKTASQSPRPYRPDLRDVDCIKAFGQRRQENVLAVFLRVRQHLCQVWGRCYQELKKWRDSKLRMPHPNNADSPTLTRHELSPCIFGVEIYGGSLPITNTPSIPELRGERDYGLQAVAKIRQFLVRYGQSIQARINFGSNRQQQRIFPKKLQVDNLYCASQQSPGPSTLRCGQSSTSFRGETNNSVLPLAQWAVYDILNAGPRQRFVVRGITQPFVVHNCVQSRCRTITTGHALTLNKYYKVVLLVHDEIIMCVPKAQAEICLRDALEIMSEPPDWNPQIPLAAEGTITECYVK